MNAPSRPAARAGLAFAALALAAGTLCACATELTFRRRAELDSLVGMDRADLIRSLGPPSRETENRGSQLLSYEDRELVWMPGDPGTPNGNNFPVGPSVAKAHCTTTFRVSGGKVDAWSLAGNECRNPAFPRLSYAQNRALAPAAQVGVDEAAGFPHNGFTGRSTVNYGEFQSQ